MSAPARDQRRRDRARRRFAAGAAALACALLLGGLLLTRSAGVLGVLGIAAVGYGIGVAVAAAFLAVGHNPLSRR